MDANEYQSRAERLQGENPLLTEDERDVLLRQAVRRDDRAVVFKLLRWSRKRGQLPESHFFVEHKLTSLPLRHEDTFVDQHLSGDNGWGRYYDLEPFGMPGTRVTLYWDKSLAQLLAADYAEESLQLFREAMQRTYNVRHMYELVQLCRERHDRLYARETDVLIKRAREYVDTLLTGYRDVYAHACRAVRHMLQPYPALETADSAMRAFRTNETIFGHKVKITEKAHMQWQRETIIDYYLGIRTYPVIVTTIYPNGEVFKKIEGT